MLKSLKNDIVHFSSNQFLIKKMKEQPLGDRPPIGKTWQQMYIFVLVFHALLITAFYIFTKSFS
jgi:hypothetical protein